MESEQSNAPFDGESWRTFGRWACWVGVAFFAVYPACNWITATRSSSLSLLVPGELSIPFIPAFVWPYLSMYLLFLTPPLALKPAELEALGKRLVIGTLVAGVMFLLMPMTLTFPRVEPPAEPYAGLFRFLFTIDQPHNLVPSLHVVFSALISLALIAASQSRLLRAAVTAWLLLLVASTLLVHQHHLLDAVSGLALASVLHLYIKGRPEHAK
mgnify:CR=1 FL=1